MMQISEQMQADIQKSGYSLSEIITMASMIEKESINDDAERKNIASVLYNRMNNSNGETAGFLQVDATIDYALKLQGKDHSSFTTSLDSPYNTYLHKGLPAGRSAARACRPSRPPSIRTRRITTSTLSARTASTTSSRRMPST